MSGRRYGAPTRRHRQQGVCKFQGPSVLVIASLAVMLAVVLGGVAAEEVLDLGKVNKKTR